MTSRTAGLLTAVAVWVVALGAAVVLAPRLPRVAVTDPFEFFPEDAPNRLASEALARLFPGAQAASQVVVVCESEAPILEAAGRIADLAARLRAAFPGDEVTRVLAPTDDPVLADRLVARDGHAALIVLRLAAGFASEEASSVVGRVEGLLREAAEPGLRTSLSGDAALGRDYLRAIEEGAERGALATIALVAVALLLAYRAPLAAGIALATLGVAAAVAVGAVVAAAELGLPVAYQSRAFLAALVWGVGTDYGLLLFARVREEAAPGLPMREAVARATRASLPVIVTSALAVALACSLLRFARFGLFADSGPPLAIAVVVMLAAMLTLAPALFALAGGRLLWPVGRGGGRSRLWAGIARAVVSHPGAVFAASLLAVAPLAAAGFGVTPSFEVELDIPDGSPSEAGFAALARHFEPAQVSPMSLVIELPAGGAHGDLRSIDALDGLYQLTHALELQPGVARVWSAAQPTGSPGRLAEATLGRQLDGVSKGLGRAVEGAEQLAAGLARAEREIASGRAELQQKERALEAERESSLLGAFAPGRFEAARRDLEALGSDLARLERGIAEAGRGAASLRDGLARGRDRLGEVEGEPGAARLLDRLALTSEDVSGSPELQRALAHYLSADAHAALFELQLEAPPNSPASVATANHLEAALPALLPALGFEGARAWISGPTAITRDLGAYTRADMERLELWIVLGVFALLLALLRSGTASVAITALILASYFAALGALRLLVEAGMWPGLDWKAPFFLFVLLVAIGADYGVFLLGRAREERARLPRVTAIARALEATGPVVTSCGLVLAGTFATLVLSRIAFLEQVGIGITIGVVIDTGIVRPFLLPAAALLLERGADLEARSTL
jgi:putative drug exporter of the RND superfamily